MATDEEMEKDPTVCVMGMHLAARARMYVAPRPSGELYKGRTVVVSRRTVLFSWMVSHQVPT